jgi:2-polyprenyl-3-methyl-5-hydroxy-6-metoxy-1,4-benzoquinol methylase
MPENLDKTVLITHAGKEHSQLVTDQEKVRKLSWIQHPYIIRYINKQISGNAEIDWLSWFKQQFAKVPFTYGLSLGCGTGLVEREALQKQICNEFDGIDITQESINRAMSLAKKNHLENQLHYSIQDLNKMKLESQKYAFILISHALHHVEKLEHVLREMKKALQPQGLILLSEYIGPSQFQFTEEQLRNMNEFLETIPEEYKRDLSKENEITYKGQVIRPTREFMNQADPSESIRSDEIVPLLKRNFEIVEKKDYGGTLLQFVLADISGNFDETKEPDRKILDKLCSLESNLIQQGKLQSDFTVIVAKHSPSPTGIRKLFSKIGLE